jgi:hypothetical protein
MGVRGTKPHGKRAEEKNSDEVLNRVWCPGGYYDSNTYWDWIFFRDRPGMEDSPFMVSRG